MTHIRLYPAYFVARYTTAAFFICGFLVCTSPINLQGQDVFENGKKFFEQRHAEADSFRANTKNIDRAIDLFQKTLEQDINPEESATYLLRSYYFKGMFTGLSEDQQKEVYQTGRELGENMIEQFPNSVPIKFWYAANVGRWADTHSFARAATSGISKKLREVCNDIIEDDPEYQGGGGYRILAQVHFYSPNIPLIMGWPSKEKALDLVKKAMEVNSDHPSNQMLHAQILLDFDRTSEAKEQLYKLQRMTPRTTHIVEDRYVKYRSQQLFEEHF